MVVVSSAMAPSCTSSLHGLSRLSRASSCASLPPPSALAEKDAQDTLLSFSDNDLHSSSPPPPLLSFQLEWQKLCREDDDARARFQATPPPPSFALGDLQEPISDGDIEGLPPLFCDEEMQAIFSAPEPQQPPSLQFSTPRSSDDHRQAGKKRMSSSPPWPSCIADDDEEGEEAAPPLALAFPPPPKKARTPTKPRSRREHGLPPLPPRSIKTARMQERSRSSRRELAAAARANAKWLRRRLRSWHKTIATRILARQFRAPELSRGRTALRCQCPELLLAAASGEREHEPRGGGGFGCCALHQDALPEHRAWMFSDHGHAPPLVGGPGMVLVPTTSTGGGKATVLQYVRWRRSVSLPTRFFVQRAAVEKQGARSAAA